MTFSDDAVSIEQSLHKELHNNFVNKINFRKMFFKTNIDDLKNMVEQIDPPAEFITTMLAEEYRQTVSLKKFAI